MPIFKFGQHKGLDFDTVTQDNPTYYFWDKRQKLPSKYLNEYLTRVEENYEVDAADKTLKNRRTQDTCEATCDAEPSTKPKTRKSKRSEMMKN